MKLNQAGIDLIKSFEGCKLRTYQCSAGVWTIGYGHTGSDVTPGKTITQEEAENLLRGDLERFVAGVRKALKVEVSENQFSALVAFAYNVGLGNLQKSTLLKFVNMRSRDASEEFLKWNKANGTVLAGLTRRRKAERELFLKG